MPPIIGITGGVERVEGVPDEQTGYAVPTTYITAVERCGGAPVILPTVELAVAAVERLDALVLTGGPDIEPQRYGDSDVHPSVTTSERDEAETRLLSEALGRGLPVLGICRGMQLLCVHFGGRLHQHLPDALGHISHRPDGAVGRHGVDIVRGSRLHQIFGDHRIVNSQHHQGVRDAGSLSVTATAPDGLIEGVESSSSEFLVGIQWHPERSIDDALLFHAVISAALRYRDGRLSAVPSARSPEIA